LYICRFSGRDPDQPCQLPILNGLLRAKDHAASVYGFAEAFAEITG
jgi:hypothetical protein